VLDLGCGTGLNHPLLVDAVGVTGAVVGLDHSPHLPDQAQRRARRHGWPQVRTVLADMVDGPGVDGFDALSLPVHCLSCPGGNKRGRGRSLRSDREVAEQWSTWRCPPVLSGCSHRWPGVACALGGSDRAGARLH